MLVIRTSAMGDVALLTPVIRALRKKYPEAGISVLTREAFNIFFTAIPGIDLINPDFTGRHRGMPGLIKLSGDLVRNAKPDLVIDLHDVIRTKVLRFLFRIRGIRVFVIEKGRGEKKAIIRGRYKRKLKHTVERYSEIFSRAGFNIDPDTGIALAVAADAEKKASEALASGGLINIGVAPFAKHALKEWPASNMKKLLQLIYSKTPCNFWFFGGADESARLEDLSKGIPNVAILAGRKSLEEELAVMQKMEFMIAMDSSNMHMAALLGVKVVSVWGATDPVTGFGPWMQPDSYIIRIPSEELTCRPCTIYGKGKCKRGDFACMNWLTPEIVFDRIVNLNIV